MTANISQENVARTAAELRRALLYDRYGDPAEILEPAADLLEALSARLAEVEAVIDANESHYGLSSNGNMWRFWSDKARETAARNTALTARAEAAEARVAKLREALESFKMTCAEDSFYKDCYLHFVLPHSLSIRIPISSDKAFIVADFEARRRAALQESKT